VPRSVVHQLGFIWDPFRMNFAYWKSGSVEHKCKECPDRAFIRIGLGCISQIRKVVKHTCMQCPGSSINEERIIGHGCE